MGGEGSLGGPDFGGQAIQIDPPARLTVPLLNQGSFMKHGDQCVLPIDNLELRQIVRLVLHGSGGICRELNAFEWLRVDKRYIPLVFM